MPAGALAKPEIVVLASMPDLTPPKPTKSTRATSSLFVGPKGSTFALAQRPTVELPYALGLPPDRTDLRMFQEASPGRAAETQLGAVDASTHRASFPASTFTRFQGWFVARTDVAPTVVVDGLDGATIKDANGNPIVGASCAVGGGFAFVGVDGSSGPGGEVGAGVVHVFERVGATWIERAPLRSPNLAAGERFGVTMAYRLDPLGLGADSLLVLASRDAAAWVGGGYDGVVYEFARAGSAWQYVDTITNPLATSYGFGAFALLAVDGDHLATTVDDTQIVDPKFGYRPAVVVMVRAGGAWTLEKEWVLPLGDTLSFPHSLALGGGNLAVGVPRDAVLGDFTGHHAGSTYVYDGAGGQWAQSARLNVTSIDQQVNDLFGESVAAGADIVAGDSGYIGASNAGLSIYGRTAGQWTLAATFANARGALTLRGESLLAGTELYRPADGVWGLAYVLDSTDVLPDVTTPGAKFLHDAAFDGTYAVQPITVYRQEGTSPETWFVRDRVAVAFFDVPQN